MGKRIKQIASISVLFFCLFLISRATVLYVKGFSLSVSIKESFTPLTTSFFWECLGLLAVILILYGIRIVIVTYHFKKYNTVKALLCSILIIGSLVGLFFFGKYWYHRNDQKTEYHYPVPLLAKVMYTDSFQKDSLVRGANVFGWHQVSKKSIKELRRLHIEWVSIMPFEYQKSASKPEIKFTNDFSIGNLRKKDSTFIKLIELCHHQGIRVMLKPHLWVEKGWRTELGLKTNEDWNIWFDQYRKIIIQYAHVAEQANAEIFCIGTELNKVIHKDPEKWSKLIVDIRNIYSGKLTYAANWHNEYKEIPFWRDLDLIGVQAYFPLRQQNKDSGKWQPVIQSYLDTLVNFAAKYQKKVLFTEMGYRSIRNNEIKPWEWPQKWDVFSKIYSEESQAKAYDHLFSKTLGREWFAGGFIWEYDFCEDDAPDAIQRYNFSPRHKKAEDVILKYYKKFYNEP